MKKLLGLSLITLVVLGSVALAEGPEGPRHRRFDFDTIDANKDGKVSKDELAADMKKRFDEHFARMDENGDGVLVREELQRGPMGHGRGRGHCDREHGQGDHGGHGQAGNPG